MRSGCISGPIIEISCVIVYQWDHSDIMHGCLITSAECQYDYRLVLCKLKPPLQLKPSNEWIRNRKIKTRDLLLNEVKVNFQAVFDQPNCPSEPFLEETPWKQLKPSSHRHVRESLSLRSKSTMIGLTKNMYWSSGYWRTKGLPTADIWYKRLAQRIRWPFTKSAGFYSTNSVEFRMVSGLTSYIEDSHALILAATWDSSNLSRQFKTQYIRFGVPYADRTVRCFSSQPQHPSSTAELNTFWPSSSQTVYKNAILHIQ